MIKIDTSGLDKLIEKLEEVDGEHEVSSDELFTDEFISSHSAFGSWDEMVEESGAQGKDEILGEPFSEFVSNNSSFSSFNEMSQAAGAEYLRKKLGF